MKPRWQKIQRPALVKPDARERLIEHFNNLPIRDDLRFWVPIEVDSLLKLMEWKSIEIPADLYVWDAESRESLEQLGNLAQRTYESLRSLSPPAHKALFTKLLALEPGNLIENLAKAAQQASKQIPTKLKGGRPPKSSNSLAAYVAKRMAEDYEILTNKRAGPGSDRETDQRNEFERLLKKVYASLGIEASAEVQARNLARDKNQPK